MLNGYAIQNALVSHKVYILGKLFTTVVNFTDNYPMFEFLFEEESSNNRQFQLYINWTLDSVNSTPAFLISSVNITTNGGCGPHSNIDLG